MIRIYLFISYYFHAVVGLFGWLFCPLHFLFSNLLVYLLTLCISILKKIQTNQTLTESMVIKEQYDQRIGKQVILKR